jgi:hypothetical protein
MSFLTNVSLSISLLALSYGLVSQSQVLKAISKSNDPVIAAAGDIACDPSNPNYNQGNGREPDCQMKATAQLLTNGGFAAVLPLGDNQYNRGTLAAFKKSYDPTWGRVKAIARPAVGNHEYYSAGAKGYYQYFGAAAGDPDKGYYSYDLGSWHLIVLNSNCDRVGGCGAGSPQEKWLKADLAAHSQACTLAYWHHPRFSSGPHGSDSAYEAFWKDLYASGVEIVLNGHDHNYERFAPQTASGKADPKRGIREFVVGTGGSSHYRFKSIQPNSQVRNADTYGVLKLTLHPKSYSWQFMPVAGKTFTDSGTDSCH